MEVCRLVEKYQHAYLEISEYGVFYRALGMKFVRKWRVLKKNNTRRYFSHSATSKTRRKQKVIRADDGHIDPDLAKRGM
jgi:hypothetical protein